MTTSRPQSLTLALLASLLVAGCGGAEPARNLSYGDSARAAYEGAKAQFDADDCFEAEPAFRKVRRDYPYSRYAALSELRIADCLAKEEKHTEAIGAYRRFIRSRPSHRGVPYARFKIAHSYFKQIPSEWLLSPPAHERDQGPTREALRQLRRFIVDYPDDRHTPEANEMVRQAVTMLAHHELYVAKFYLARGHAAGAQMRLETLVIAYEGSEVEPEAMLLLGQVYVQVGKRREAKETLERLVRVHERSDEAGEARQLLQSL